MPRGIAKNPEEKSKKISKFMLGNKHTLGFKQSESAKLKRSIALKGRISPMKGKKHSEETKRLMSSSGMGHICSTETREKISKKQKGKIIPPEIIKKVSLALKGRKVWNTGKIGCYSDETRKKMSESRKGLTVGENHPNWQGGLSFEPYTTDWTNTLKRSIRERDKYICQLCKEPQGDTALSVHHIDYNKKNCNPDNLISLCRKCHLKTNYSREYWLAFFTR